MGGEIAEEINSAGQTIIYVYLPDGTLLSTLVGFPKWKNAVPAGTGLYETFQSGFVNRVEFDPFKANVGLAAPPPPDTNGGDGDIGGNHNGGPSDSRFSDMSNPAAGCFDVEGVVLPCTWSIFDVLDVFVWGPARNPSANTRTDTAVWVPPKRVVPINIPNPFTQFLTGEDLDTATVSTTYVPGHWQYAPAPFVRVNSQQSAQNVSPEQRASNRADDILRNNQDCANFITELISLTADTAIQPFNSPPTPNFGPILGPNGLEPSYQPNIALQTYNSALAQGRVTASGRSGVHGNYITYGTTTGFTTIAWNREFYRLSLDEQALMTLHESLHLFANFTDFAVADAAHMLATRNKTSPGTRGNFSSQDAASVYINEQIAAHCR